MDYAIPHNLSLPLARLVTHKALASYQERYPEFHPSGKWVSEDQADFELHAKGEHVRGQVAVTRASVDFHLQIPLLLRPFQDGVVKMVAEEVQLWLRWAAEGRFDNEVPPEARARRAGP
jgi:hypothetical protein